MRSFRLLIPVDVNDLLSDWSRYCRQNDMILGVVATNLTHSFMIYSNHQSCCINIDHPNGETPLETLDLYLKDYCRRNTHVTVTEIDNESLLISRSQNEEDSVGIIIEG